MPVYEFHCGLCGRKDDWYVNSPKRPLPECCERPMTRTFAGSFLIKQGPPLWTDRMDEIHKRQADRGEKLRIVQPWEIGAT